MSVESEAFRRSNKTIEELYQQVQTVKEDFRRWSGWFGGFLGLVVAWKLIALSVVRRRSDYEADRGVCVSCGRCFVYCPVGTENDIVRKQETAI